MDAYELYQNKMSNRGATPREYALKVKSRDFENYFEHTINRECVLVIDNKNVSRKIDMAFQDHSQSNNKQLSDDKYIIARNEDPIHVGDYIQWRNDWWMIFTEEFKTIPSHQQALVKNSNHFIKWIRGGKIVNDGIGFPAYVQSNTLYTMGVSETTYIDVPDGKMMMYMQYNQLTADIRQDERIVIGAKIFKVKFMDFVSRQGLISFLLDEDRIHEDYDNMELGVADYYRYYDKEEDFTDEELENDIGGSDALIISGETSPKVGTINVYTTEFDVEEWVVDDTNPEGAFYLQNKDSRTLSIKIKNDYRFIGSKINIIAKDSNGNYVSLPLTVGKRF